MKPDVNILSGINGSGKSTLLNCMAVLVATGAIPNGLGELVQSVSVSFNNGKSISFERTKEVLKGLETEMRPSLDDQNITLEEFRSLLEVAIISTFDNEIIEVGKRPDESVRTELDRDIFRLQKQYLDYQLNIGKKAFEVVTHSNGHAQEEVLKIKAQQDRFLEIIDNLFKDTDKKINRKNNEITFLRGVDEITAYQLSSGEKQILVILLTALVQDNKPSIIFMDEPEISLHFDWQKKLIQYIREINPNAQIILATHSPAVIMEGWADKVSNVSDLITNDRLKGKK